MPKICRGSKLDKDVDYRQIQNFPKYYVGNDGSVWSLNGRFGTTRKLARKLRQSLATTGMYIVTLCRNGNEEHKKGVHRLVIETFKGPPGPNQECLHSNGICTDNRPDNLRWGTRAENEADKILHGTSNRGTRNGQAKLTEEDVLKIWELLKQGVKVGKIAKMFGVVQPNISKIKSGKSWAWLTQHHG